MQNLSGQGFHVASGSSVLGHTVAGDTRFPVIVEKSTDLRVEHVVHALCDPVAGMDPLDVMMAKQGGEVATFEISTTGCGRKKLSLPVTQRNAEAETPSDQRTKVPVCHHQQPILRARASRSNAEERNSVALVATNDKGRDVRQKGLKQKTQKHKIRFGGLCF